MIRATVTGLEDVKGYFTALTKNQIPYASMLALNDVAFDVMRKQKELIKSVFPTAKPQTAKNIFVRKATKDLLSAVIHFDQLYNKGIDEYMMANIAGGHRAMKPSEKRLGTFYTPGRGAKLDKYGNMKGGQITQVLSRLGRFGDVAGYNMNQTAASKKRKGSRAAEFFMIQQKHGGLLPGVYQRLKGRGTLPIMFFIKQAPQYKAVWPFYQAGQEVVDKTLRPAFEARIEFALRSAR
jgi:hypothetical protein